MNTQSVNQPEPAAGNPIRRPWQALLLTVLQAVNTVMLVVSGVNVRDKVFVDTDGTSMDGSGLSIFTFMIAGLSLLLTVGLARRSNLAWAFVVIVSALNALRSLGNPLALGFSVAILVLALMPTTSSWYRKKAGRTNLSISKGFLVVMALFVLCALGFFALLTFAG
jgi:lysylphosphatidylglycerol synthetase-like protein (DUF2156 family)